MNSKKSSDTKQPVDKKYDTNAAQEGMPAVPLPNPGEGGAVYPGMPEEEMQQNELSWLLTSL